MPFQYDQAMDAIHCNLPVHCVHLVLHVAAKFSVAGKRVFLNSFSQTAFFGREKEASDLTSEASADRSDFLTSHIVRD
jgi:hypothetical protein